MQTLAESLSQMTPEHLPAFTDALYVVIGLAVVVGFIVIFQAMYTAVLERTREIGILKSLGASQTYIVDLVLRETAFLSIVGIVLGIAPPFAEEGDGYPLPKHSFSGRSSLDHCRDPDRARRGPGGRKLPSAEGRPQRSNRGAGLRVVLPETVKNGSADPGTCCNVS